MIISRLRKTLALSEQEMTAKLAELTTEKNELAKDNADLTRKVFVMCIYIHKYIILYIIMY